MEPRRGGRRQAILPWLHLNAVCGITGKRGRPGLSSSDLLECWLLPRYWTVSLIAAWKRVGWTARRPGVAGWYREVWKMLDHDGGKVGAVDLDGMTVQQLTALIAAAEAKRREKREGAVTALRMEMERKAAELGISAGELFPPAAQQVATEQRTRGRKPRSDAGTKRPVKSTYRGPNDETWSGRGRTPRWLTALEAEGRNRAEFAVAPEPELGLA